MMTKSMTAPDFAGDEPFWKDGRRTPANGCCSAVEPCSWQQRSPNTLCAVCTDARRPADRPGDTAAALAPVLCEICRQPMGDDPGVPDEYGMIAHLTCYDAEHVPVELVSASAGKKPGYGSLALALKQAEEREVAAGARADGAAAEVDRLREQVATLSGQTGGAVPAGDLRFADEAMVSAAMQFWRREANGNIAYAFAEGVINAALAARLAEQPGGGLVAPGVGEQDWRGLAAAALKDFDDLVNDSEGLYGYHGNGDLAPWDEFDGYLNGIDSLRAALDGASSGGESDRG